jgi:hypothetical protein
MSGWHARCLHDVDLVHAIRSGFPCTADPSKHRQVSALGEIGLGHYSFVVDVSGIDTETGSYEDAFYQAGCSDALIMVTNGHLRLDFDRSAASYELAVESALRDITKAGGTVTDIKKTVI